MFYAVNDISINDILTLRLHNVNNTVIKALQHIYKADALLRMPYISSIKDDQNMHENGINIFHTTDI